MRITKNELTLAGVEANKRKANVYVIENKGELHIEVNPPSYSVSAEMKILQTLSPDEIKNDSVIYKNENYNLKTFCNKVNKQYSK